MKRNFRWLIGLFTILTAILSPALAAGQSSTGQSDLDVRREALRDSILANIHGATIAKHIYDVTKFGAKGDGTSDALPAFRKAIDTIAKSKGGCLKVPAGTYFLRGPLTLVSNLCIELDEGATLKFDPDPELYPIVKTSWEGTYLYNYSPMIYG
ncbi:MAG: hypothetical protein K2H57_04570, partial [Duncaniella sp.]|nr:hypothetical protein [Duncaniella sp.]